MASSSAKLTEKASKHNSKLKQKTDSRPSDARISDVKDIYGNSWTYRDSEISSLRHEIQELQSQAAQSRKSKHSADETARMLGDMFDTNDIQRKAIEHLRIDTTKRMRELEETVTRQSKRIAKLKAERRQDHLAQQEIKKTMNAKFEAMAKENKKTLDALKSATALMKESQETSRKLNGQIQNLLQKAGICV
ncbi:hypothetical protein M7I_0923 [Glarea lozoyensis 74030]|uniref:Uncharacterized protein n=1 Tax=Glarea lozoyensis (strain ATCC 74030 / MF5533) TaxID=1104152 RepID=H0EEP3_GLAL7|nr:hypothetical protein M7I_0923 [Glarea lozoyensis 74030]